MQVHSVPSIFMSHPMLMGKEPHFEGMECFYHSASTVICTSATHMENNSEALNLIP